MSKVEITINGNKIMAEKGNNLLETALQNGIDIPHLCYDPRIKPFGSCRLCFIETGGPRGPVAACGTVVAEGMAVVTDNESLYKLRKTALELLLSEHCGDCIAPCQEACPAHIDIQGYIALLDRKEYKKAAELIKEKMPLPSICGRVCPRFCEDQCRRNMVDDPVNICDLKRFAGDYDLEMIDSYKTKAIADSGKTVAVVGGGPAGLTVAYYLALKGHRVTLFDRGPKLGGMLRYGIPEYRLPKALLDREINLIAGLCREVRLGEVLGKDFTIEDLTDQYDAVFLGLGCQSAQGMGLEGEDRPGILKGIDLLRSVAEGTPPVLGKKVAVIGGGNTAMDAARTALRLGSEEVHLIYRRSRNEMPAALIEIEEAEEEGIKFDYLTNPVSVLGTDCVKGVGCVQMKLGEPDESGRCRPLVVEGSEFMLEVDNVIMAIGQTLDQESTCACSIELKGKTMAACSDTGQTSIDKVFAAGDAVTGPATVVEAVGAARNVALAINRYLQGLTVESESESYNCSMGRLDLLDPEDFSEYPKEVRLPVHHLAPEVRKKSFVEYNQGLSEEDVVKETKRCLSCGCQNVFDCSLRQLATDFKLDNERLGTEKKRYPIRNDHLFIVQDPNKCVLCANCVRICHEVQGANALCLVNRGYDTIISPTLQLPLNETTCESCGQCISVCPTGALTAKGYFFKPGPWFPDRVVESTCTRCGIGCRVELSVVANRVIEINSPLRQDLNDGNLCIRGRYEPLFAQDTDRILKPFINFDGQKKLEINWPEALERAATGLVRVKKESGPGSIAVIITSSLSNEEMILTQQLAVDVLGSDRIYSTGLTPATASIIGKPLFYKEIAESDFILVVDADLPEDYPIVAQKIRKALAQEAKLVFIGTAANRLVKDADVSVLCNPGKLKSILNTLLYYQSGKEKHLSLSDSELTEALASLPQDLSDNPSVLVQIAELFLKSSKPVVIINGDTTDRETYDLLAELYRQAGNDLNPSILALYRGGNTAGLIEMGFAKGLVDGKALSLGCNSDQVVTELLKQMKGLLLIGDDPAALIDLAAPDSFIVAMAAYNQSKLQKADLVLPLAGYFETTGTVVNSERRLCELRLAYAPLAGKSNSALLIDLAKALGANLEPITKNQVVERISQLLSLED
ncbi:MAG: FAD-dependent oxidoreductase [Firmicutes bacterium]|nr:FAD-dependent oxidoreductase [Bacillota bacterium]